MTHQEQQEVADLREQLTNAQRDAEQARAQCSSAIHQTSGEIRLYRGLFWFLLALATVVTIVKILER